MSCAVSAAYLSNSAVPGRPAFIGQKNNWFTGKSAIQDILLEIRPKLVLILARFAVGCAHLSGLRPFSVGTTSRIRKSYKKFFENMATAIVR